MAPSLPRRPRLEVVSPGRLAAGEHPPRPTGNNVRALPVGERVDDEQLVAWALGEDETVRAEAEDAIYRRHDQAIAGVALRILRNRVDMEDVVQVTFLIAFKRLRSLNDGSLLRPWLIKIATRQALRHIKKRKWLRFFGLGSADAPLSTLESTALGPEAGAELVKLNLALEGLSEDRRIAWLLRRVEDWPIEEVAGVLKVSASTAKRRIGEADAYVRRYVHLKEVL